MDPNYPGLQNLPNVIGDFTRTGWDYIGEAGIGIPGYRFGEGGMTAAFPCQLSYCADLDLIPHGPSGAAKAGRSSWKSIPPATRPNFS